MKKQFLILLLLFVSFVPLLSKGNSPFRRILGAATFDVQVNPFDENNIIAGGEYRQFYRTHDGGKTWDTLPVGFIGGRAQFNNIAMHTIDTNIVILGGLNFGVVEQTTDQGNSWNIVLQKDYPPISLNGKALIGKPDDPNTFYISELARGACFRTTDKGFTWDSLSTVFKEKKMLDTNGNLVDSLYPIMTGAIGIRADSTNILFIGSTTADIFISSNGGYTWKITDSIVTERPKIDAADGEITRIVFSNRDSITGYSIITYLQEGNLPNGGLWKTTDGGYNWSLLGFLDSSFWAASCRKRGNVDEIWVGGYTESYYHYKHPPGVGIVRGSTDGGVTWTNYDKDMDWIVENPQSSSDVLSWSWISDSNAYAVGWYGLILQFSHDELSWRPITPYNPPPFNNQRNQNSVFFTNERTGYIACNNGLITKSKEPDTGIRWDTLVTNTNENLRSIVFTDSLTGYVCGDNGTILKTTDEGNNWIIRNSNVTVNLKSIASPQSGTVFCVGQEGTIIKSSNSGQDWYKINTGVTSNLRSIGFKNNNVGYITGDSGVILKSQNGGFTWQNFNTGTSKYINSVHFLNENKGLAVGETGLILTTTDGGSSWNRINIDTIFVDSVTDLNLCRIVNDSLYIIAGNYRMVLYSTDRGQNWNVTTWGFGPRANCWSLRYFGKPGQEKLYLATECGLFINDQITDVEKTPSENKNYGKLSIIIDETRNLKINYQAKNINNKITIRISDIKGNLVLEKQFDTYDSNIFETMINLPVGLPMGAYACQIIDGQNSTSELIILE